ncbi:hypothetical protein CBL_05322 [Carabus blaptoides fortunei]
MKYGLKCQNVYFRVNASRAPHKSTFSGPSEHRPGRRGGVERAGHVYDVSKIFTNSYKSPITWMHSFASTKGVGKLDIGLSTRYLYPSQPSSHSHTFIPAPPCCSALSGQIRKRVNDNGCAHRGSEEDRSELMMTPAGTSTNHKRIEILPIASQIVELNLLASD